MECRLNSQNRFDLSLPRFRTQFHDFMFVLQWPPLVEVVDTWELPPVLIERYNTAGGEGTALCGIFPEIQRAWASVDNSLFLWRFDKW